MRSQYPQIRQRNNYLLAMIDKRIWLSYDLGIGGDYEGLYSFLDSYGARECGNSIATLEYPIKKDDDSLLVKSIKDELANYIKLDRKTRIYLVRRVVTEDGTYIRGSFIFGGRRAAPWEGASMKQSEDDE